jgi:hypothetical protein
MPEENPPLGESIGWQAKEISTLSKVSDADINQAKELVDKETPELGQILDAE